MVISIGSPSTAPPASVTFPTDPSMSSTAMTMDGCCAGQSGLFEKKAAVDRAGLTRAALVGLGGRQDVVAHVLAKHPRLPAEC
jgi:hypothetical protein